MTMEDPCLLSPLELVDQSVSLGRNFAKTSRSAQQEELQKRSEEVLFNLAGE